MRVIHASSDAGEVDVYAKERDKALFDGVSFRSEVGYKEVEPMTATVEVRPKGKKSTLATTSNVKWEAGKTCTIIVTGRVKAAPKLEAVTVEDQLGSNTASTITVSKLLSSRSYHPQHWEFDVEMQSRSSLLYLYRSGSERAATGCRLQPIHDARMILADDQITA